MMTGNGTISLQKWLRRYWVAMCAFLVLVFFVGQSFLLILLTKRAERNIQNSIAAASNGIEDSLNVVDSFIYEALYSGTTQTTSQLYRALSNETDPVLLPQTQRTVQDSLQSITTWSGMIDFILLYTDREDGGYWLDAGLQQTYNDRLIVKAHLNEIIQAEENQELGRYFICRDEDHRYMLRLIKIEGSYLVVCVSAERLLSSFESASYDKNCIPFAAEKDGTLIFSDGKPDQKIDVENEGKYVTVDGTKYLQTGYVSEKTGYYFGVLTRRSSIMEDMWAYRILFILTFMGLIFMVPASFFFIYRYLERPIETLSKAMDQVAAGESEISVKEEPKIFEIRKLMQTFNHMSERIHTLKIEKYEVKLQAQKATMQYLQLQIKPHFYANMLNIIYSLAERKDFETIQKISNAIVNFSRYMFRDASELVELKREIEHVHYYMEIQEIRYMMQIGCDIEVPEEIMNALIPPFIIQNFVENSVKYAFSTRNNCMIRICITPDEKREYLYLTIRDNGNGFSDELLNVDWDEKDEQGHIGLSNVYMRMHLIYGENCRLNLKNDEGAVVEMKIPYISIDNMDFEDDF